MIAHYKAKYLFLKMTPKKIGWTQPPLALKPFENILSGAVDDTILYIFVPCVFE